MVSFVENYHIFIGLIRMSHTGMEVSLEAGIARINATVLGNSQASIQHGIPILGEAASTCNSLCCAQLSCDSACANVTTVLFLVEYFDSEPPLILSSFLMSGPSFGGSEIFLKVANFPLVPHSIDNEVLFGSAHLRGEVVVQTSR